MEACTFANPLTDDEFELLLEGDADHAAALKHHLRQCDYCRQRFVKVLQFEQALVKAVFRKTCPSPDELADYALGEAVSDVFEQHIQTCERCQSDLRNWEGFFATPDTGVVYETLPAARAPRVFRIPFQSGRSAGMAAQVRSSGSGFDGDVVKVDQVKIHFYTRDHQIDEFTLSGRIVDDEDPERWTETLLEVYDNGELISTAWIDDEGLFSCKSKPQGSVSIKFTAKDAKIVIIEDI